GCGPSSGLPSASIAPVVGFSRPAAICNSVDLPQPDGPTRATSSPSWISRLKFSMTFRSENFFSIFWNDSFICVRFTNWLYRTLLFAVRRHKNFYDLCLYDEAI